MYILELPLDNIPLDEYQCAFVSDDHCVIIINKLPYRLSLVATEQLIKDLIICLEK